MTEIVKIAASAVNAKLHNASREAKLEVQRVLSYKVAGAENSTLFKSGAWDGRSSFLDFRAGTFPAGFVHLVSAHLKRKGFNPQLIRKPLPGAIGPENPIVDTFPEDPRYDYQREVVNRLERHGQIIAQVATGGGKSRIARLAFARLNRPTLFLTTRGILMYQMKEAFERDLGVPCSVLGDGQFGFTDEYGNSYIKKMSVGMVQTLTSRLEETTIEKEFEKLYDAALKKKEKFKPEAAKRIAEKKVVERQKIRQQTINLLNKFEFVILEEAHEASGNSYYEILRHCKNAHYRLALTGTPFMKDDEESNMRLMASSGPIAIKVSEKMLIDRGILAKPYFKFVELTKRPPKLLRGTSWQPAYRIGIVDNVERNEAICNEVARAREYGLTSMVLIQQKRHGDILMEMFAKRGLRVKFIQGEDDQVNRKRALQKLGNGDIDVLIGTTILDVGVDVPAVGLIVLAGGGKAEVALRQRIGRGLRAKKTGPNCAFIVDFMDQFNHYTSAHAQQRQSIIRDTEGFGENIVSGDFDYESLGFTKKEPTA